MIWVLVTIGYFVIGMLAARVAFVGLLEDSPRKRRSSYSGRTETTSEYDTALSWAWFCFLLWPLALVLLVIGVVGMGIGQLVEKSVLKPTKHERAEMKRLEHARVTKELEQQTESFNAYLETCNVDSLMMIDKT